MTGIAKTHVSPAIKNLDSKGWICEMPDGQFLLTEPGLKVTESVTENDGIGNKTVTELVTISETELRNRELVVTESVTKVTESVTDNKDSFEHSLNIEENIEEGEEENPPASEFQVPKNISPPKFNYPIIKAIREISGHNPDPVTYDKLIQLFGDTFDRFKLENCFVEWRLKKYRSDNCGWATDWYFNGIPEYQNGSGKPKTIDPGKPPETPESYEPDPPCRFCGREFCLSLHEEERRAEKLAQCH